VVIPDVRNVLAAQLPGYRIDSVVPLGDGLDNVAFEVNGELIVRMGRRPDPERLQREAGLLAIVAGAVPVAVPEPVFTVPELGCLAYAKLAGTPLLDLSPGPAVVATLGEFLAALHALPVERVTGLVDVDDEPLTEWRREAAATYAAVAEHVPAAHRATIEAFLDAPPPAAAPVLAFSHNDLGIEHVLVDPRTGTVTGVIDWSDAAIVDPACDFGRLYRDLGPAVVGGQSAGTCERAAFYARCGVLEDLSYGLATGRHRYTDKSLAALDRLFPPRR
jgi:aminoglycoside phosphotransferase (APT) family kinase protein